MLLTTSFFMLTQAPLFTLSFVEENMKKTLITQRLAKISLSRWALTALHPVQQEAFVLVVCS